MLDVTKKRAGKESPAREAMQRQVVLVFQGGGALGAYQAGVYRLCTKPASSRIGSSAHPLVPSTRASLPAMSLEDRLDQAGGVLAPDDAQRIVAVCGLAGNFPTRPSYWSTLLGGIPGFFEPNPLGIVGAHYPIRKGHSRVLSTAPLEKTLAELVDFALVKRCTPRLTVGAAQVRTSEMRCFDSRKRDHRATRDGIWRAAAGVSGRSHRGRALLGRRHSFQYTNRDDFEDNPRRNSLIFAVHMWNPMGAGTRNDLGGLHRQKDIQYSSRVASHIARQRQVHRAAPCRLASWSNSYRRANARTGRQGFGRIWLPDADARRATSGASARQRKSHQRYRF